MNAENQRALQRGACPSLWTPMESGDGLLVRVRGGHGARGLRVAEVRALAQLASEHGNGWIELTRRGRLQLRGVRAETLGALQTALVELGLAEHSAARERSAALITNPYSGLSHGCVELDALARELERALAEEPACERLSDKFGVVLDSGFTLRDIAADIHVDVSVDAPELASIHVANNGGWLPLGESPLSHVVPVVIELCRELASAGEKVRMRTLVASGGLEQLRARIELALPAPFAVRKSVTREREAASAPRGVVELRGDSQPLSAALGFHTAARSWLELGVAFGAGTRDLWNAVADLSARFGDGEIRFTPARRVLVCGVAEHNRDAALRVAADAGLITDAADPLLRTVACPGAPACSSAHGETRALARELAPLLAAGESLHVSGCAKGCAHSSTSDVVLVRDPRGLALGLGQTAAEAADGPILAADRVRARFMQPRSAAGATAAEVLAAEPKHVVGGGREASARRPGARDVIGENSEERARTQVATRPAASEADTRAASAEETSPEPRVFAVRTDGTEAAPSGLAHEPKTEQARHPATPA